MVRVRSFGPAATLCLLLGLAASSIGMGAPPPGAAPQGGPAAAPAEPPSCKILHVYPHDAQAFTQGLIFADGFLYESTGLYGRSSLRKVDLQSGQVLKRVDLAPSLFGEGLCRWKQTLVQLTWRSQVGFVYDMESFATQRELSYTGEGWGLTEDGTLLIMSDGTAVLRFLDPQDFREVARVKVSDHGVPVANLNELEYVKGEIFANIWGQDRVARISPRTGEVLGWLDFAPLRAQLPAPGQAEVLNGLAYDPAKNRLFVTGKLWPKLFEIELPPAPGVNSEQ